MEQFVFKRTMNKDEAWKIAEKKNSWLWNLVFHKMKLSEIRLVYFEYLIIDYETNSQPSLMQRIRNKGIKQLESVRKRIPVLYNGSTGQVALVADHPEIQVMDFEDDDEALQHSVYPENTAIEIGKKLAQRIAHRFMGGLHEIDVVEYKSVYRPFWVAFYGEVKQGEKVRYISIPADGGNNKRVR